MMLPRGIALISLIGTALAAQLSSFTAVQVRDGLSRTVIIQPGTAGNYSVSDKKDLLVEVSDGILTLRPNETAVQQTDVNQFNQVISAVTSGLLSGLLSGGSTPSPTSAGSTQKADSGPIRVKLPASALASVYSESTSADVVVGNFSATRLNSLNITQNGGARLVVLQLNADNVTANSGGTGHLYLMGNIRNVALTSTGVGSVYIGSSTKSLARIGTVNVTAQGPPGAGDIVINSDSVNTTIMGSQAVQPILYSRGTCKVTADVVNSLGATATVNVCTRLAGVDPPSFGPYWRLAANNATSAMSPAGAPAAAPMGQVAYFVPDAPALAPSAAASPVAPMASAALMAPLPGLTAPAPAPALAPMATVASIVGPGLQQIQPTIPVAAGPASTEAQAPAPAIVFFPATVVADTAPAPAPQAAYTLPLRRRMQALA